MVEYQPSPVTEIPKKQSLKFGQNWVGSSKDVAHNLFVWCGVFIKNYVKSKLGTIQKLLNPFLDPLDLPNSKRSK